jgi:hypothetical protein
MGGQAAGVDPRRQPGGVADEVFAGMARVVVGEQPEPAPAAAVFLAAVDAGELERSGSPAATPTPP